MKMKTLMIVSILLLFPVFTQAGDETSLYFITPQDGDVVSGYYFNANTGCYGYLLRIGGNIATERYFEPGG